MGATKEHCCLSFTHKSWHRIKYSSPTHDTAVRTSNTFCFSFPPLPDSGGRYFRTPDNWTWSFGVRQEGRRAKNRCRCCRSRSTRLVTGRTAACVGWAESVQLVVVQMLLFQCSVMIINLDRTIAQIYAFQKVCLCQLFRQTSRVQWSRVFVAK